jgi:hypothetical protein
MILLAPSRSVNFGLNRATFDWDVAESTKDTARGPPGTFTFGGYCPVPRRVSLLPVGEIGDIGDGEEIQRIPRKPQSWAALIKDATAIDLKLLPVTIQREPDFALIFLIAYPHRASVTLVKALDKWFE